MLAGIFITQDKRRNKRNILHCVNLTFKLFEKCDLFTTPLSRNLIMLQFIGTKERKACHRNIK